jgi:hypothetical protein
MSIEERETPESITRGHEPIETDVRAVWRTAAAIVGVVLATFVLAAGMTKWFTNMEGSPASGDAAKPDLNWAQQNPLQQLRSQEQKLLDNYGWIDRQAGIARIPVDRAMEIISQNGLPTQLQGPSAPAQNSTQQMDEPEISPTNAERTEP